MSADQPSREPQASPSNVRRHWDDTSASARRALSDAGRWIDARGWCPATGGNFSSRLPSLRRDQSDLVETQPESVIQRCVVTASGRHKGALTESDYLEVDLFGAPLVSGLTVRPSAETLVHVMLYRLSPEIGAILHTHSIPNTVLSLIEPTSRLTIEGFEMQKSLSGQQDHTTPTTLEIFDNTQDMEALAREVKARWALREGLRWGLLVRGHGVYVWGRDIDEARRHLEGVEFLLSCMLELERLGASHPDIESQVTPQSCLTALLAVLCERWKF